MCFCVCVFLFVYYYFGVIQDGRFFHTQLKGVFVNFVDLLELALLLLLLLAQAKEGRKEGVGCRGPRSCVK